MKLTERETDILWRWCAQYSGGLITQDQLDQQVCELLNLSQAELEQFDLTPYWPCASA